MAESTDRQVDAGIHFALACMYALYRTWGRYPGEIAQIMRMILELDRRKYCDDMKKEANND